VAWARRRSTLLFQSWRGKAGSGRSAGWFHPVRPSTRPFNLPETVRWNIKVNNRYLTAEQEASVMPANLIASTTKVLLWSIVTRLRFEGRLGRSPSGRMRARSELMPRPACPFTQPDM
jgi:hypothetical protein